MNERIAVIGLGYVGMPLAAAFSKLVPVVGYDVSEKRVGELKSGVDATLELTAEELKNPNLSFTCDPADLVDSTFYIVTVPTPITEDYTPDLTCLKESSAVLGGVLKAGDVVVYESTVYPGVTEETCLPILEKESGLKLGDFQLGYSPERINPGDKEHTLTRVIKVVSGHDQAALERIATTYESIIDAGVHRAPTIKTAEGSKVIENVQRDLNIALMNELSQIFSLLGVRTQDVIDAAATKWNFHPYTPGLVGGHCIGVDPYYLTKRAMDFRYHAEVILAGRRINDSMGVYVGKKVFEKLVSIGVLPKGAKVWVWGLTFKENVPDFRNTRAVDVVDELVAHGCDVKVWEPMAEPEQIKQYFGYDTEDFDTVSDVDALVVINGHDVFKSITLEQLKTKMRTPLIWDVKNFFDREEAEAQGFEYGSL